MSDKNKIEWADATVNAINGCDPISPGCTNCYAMASGGRNLPSHPSTGLTKATKAGHVWTGEVRLNEKALLMPLSWKRPRRIFWNAHGDTFHENVPDEWIDRMFAVMAITPHHIHMVLTKRAERMLAYFDRMSKAHKHFSYVHDDDWDGPWVALAQTASDMELDFSDIQCEWPLPNVWLGVSVEDQARADERRQDFKATSAATKFVSYEPALEIVDWTGWEFVNQIISGGESGGRARFVKNDAYRGARDFCSKHQIAYFHKQNGEWIELEHDTDWDKWGYVSGRDDHRVAHSPSQDANFFRLGKKRAGRLLDSVEHNGVPS